MLVPQRKKGTSSSSLAAMRILVSKGLLCIVLSTLGKIYHKKVKRIK
jgi:hypothetical protein